VQQVVRDEAGFGVGHVLELEVVGDASWGADVVGPSYSPVLRFSAS
jgi:hypothetical protein